MANTVTLAQLKTRARQHADMENSTFITEPELLDYINGSYAELYDIVVGKFEDYYVVDTPFTITSGNTEPLPSDFYKLRGLDYKIDANNFIALDKFNFRKRNILNRSTAYSGLNKYLQYRIIGSNIVIEPEDNAAGEYKIWYTPVVTKLVNDGDLVDGINGYEDYIVIDVAIKMLSKEESSTTHLERQKEALLNRIEVAAQNRDYDQPESITDVDDDNEFVIDRIF